MSFASPFWLLALLPLLAVAVLLGRYPHAIKASFPGAWSQVVHPQMQPEMARRVVGQTSGLMPVCLGVAVLLVLALARPSLGGPQVTDFENLVGRAIILDMSGVVDVLEQKRIATILVTRAPEFPTTLIAVASDGYEVVPLTRDAEFLQRFLQVMDAAMMPEGGRALHLGVLHAEAVLERANIVTRQVILLTGGTLPDTLAQVQGTEHHGALIAIGATQDGWNGPAQTLALDLVDQGATQDLNSDLRRRAHRASHDISQNGQIKLAPYLLACAGLCWLLLFRRRLLQ